MKASVTATTRVLVIDDSDFSRETMRAILEPRGWEVHTLESPLGATAAIVRLRTNVVVVDVNMPVMSGAKFVELMRKNSMLDHVKLVLVSGDSEDELTRLGESLGADAMLPKKVLAERLVATVERLTAGIRERPKSGARGKPSVLLLDETTAGETVQRLEKLNVTVMHRRTGRGCLTSLRDSKPDVVFVSTTLDDMPARAVIELIRENPDTARVPVVLIGDAAETQLASEALRIGARGHLPRALDEASFQQRVERILSTLRR